MTERIVRFGAGSFGSLGEVAAELGVRRLLVVTTRRGAEAATGLAVSGVFAGVRPHVPVESVREAAALARELHADGLVALGGGSAVDTAKAVVVELLPEVEARVVAVPTTYAGAEWTPYFGVLLAPGSKGGGSDERARPVAAIYDPELTAGLPAAVTVGTALNALAHCAEAYYHPSCTGDAARAADRGAAALAAGLPLVVAEPGSLAARTLLLEGAMHAATALDASGLCLGHAMAQGLGGRFGLPHGTMNALCLPPALRFNAVVVLDEIARLGDAIGRDDPVAGVEELASLGAFGRLRDHGVPRDGLAAVAADIATRGGARANPRPAPPDQIAELLLSIW